MRAMTSTGRPIGFWVLVVFLVVSIGLMLMGQTMAVFNYDLAVGWGLQERPEDMTEFGVQVNRAFGAADTVVNIPLMLISMIGLIFRKHWSLLVTAAFFGASAYWSVTVTFMLAFLPGVAGYNNVPGAEIWLFIGTYMVVGVVGLFYIVLRGEELLR
jgi:hypothetical protein